MQHSELQPWSFLCANTVWIVIIKHQVIGAEQHLALCHSDLSRWIEADLISYRKALLLWIFFSNAFIEKLPVLLTLMGSFPIVNTKVLSHTQCSCFYSTDLRVKWNRSIKIYSKSQYQSSSKGGLTTAVIAPAIMPWLCFWLDL